MTTNTGQPDRFFGNTHAILGLSVLVFVSALNLIRAEDCLTANETCLKDNKCKSLLQSVPTLCGDSGKLRCTATRIDHCRSVLRELVKHEYLRNCDCPHDMNRYADCETFKDNVFLHPCGEIYQEGKDEVLIRSLDEDGDDYNVELWEPTMEKRSRDSGPSCVALRKECLSDDECGQDLRQFRQACKVRRGRCYAESRGECIQAYENIRPYGLFKCSCENHRGHIRRKCEGLLKRFVKNACLLVANEVAKIGKENSQLPEKPEAVVPDETLVEEEEDTRIKVVDPPTTAPTVAKVTIPRVEPEPFKSSECYDAFGECNKDYLCRRKMGKFIASCQWDMQKKSCDKKKCLPDMGDFYQNVAVKHAHAAAFCTCAKGDVKCESLRSVLQSQCAIRENPIPTCVAVVRKCQADEICRRKWEYYDTYCHTDSKTGRCIHGNHLCRDAVVGLMGTLLMTNCSCSGISQETRGRCMSLQEKLQKNKCRDQAVASSTIVYHETTPATLLKDDKEMIKFEVVLSKNPPARQVCDRMLQSDRSPIVRVYPNNTDCSVLCKCLPNGTQECRHLPCLPEDSCKIGFIIYGHGSVLTRNNRGTCKCYKGEIICAKSKDTLTNRNGIFLYIGYSLMDQQLLTKYGNIRFSYAELMKKLVRLLNGGTDNMDCRLHIISKTDGNVVFEAIAAGHTPGYTGEGCVYQAKLLSYMINSRHSSVKTDPIVSTIRVAMVDIIQHHGSQSGVRQVPYQSSISDKKGSAASLKHSLACSFATVLAILFCMTSSRSFLT
ncbi:uncharacterized protein LOC141912862 [Tubulanus polymorphus]|uniref:uncharacterized protein LOC141912862 n=1 Tax=Tubulanus polymorphus TaxID=672921 RepID=UPI003DA4DBBA